MIIEAPKIPASGKAILYKVGLVSSISKNVAMIPIKPKTPIPSMKSWAFLLTLVVKFWGIQLTARAAPKNNPILWVSVPKYTWLTFEAFEASSENETSSSVTPDAAAITSAAIGMRFLPKRLRIK